MVDWRRLVLAIRAAAILFSVVAAESGLRHMAWAAVIMLRVTAPPGLRFVLPEVALGAPMLVLSGACVWMFFRPQRVARWLARRVAE